MNAKEIIEELENFKGTTEEQEDSWWNSRSAIGHSDFDKTELTTKLGEFEYKWCEKRAGNGDHDSAETVIYFKDHDIYIMLDGYYSSQEGTDFDEGEFKEVYPKTKTIEYFSTKK